MKQNSEISLTYFKEGDILYLGIIESENKRLVCQQVRVYKTEGLLVEAGCTNEMGQTFEEETMMQRLYINEEDYLDVPVEKEICVSLDREYVLNGLQSLKYDCPIYFLNMEGEESLLAVNCQIKN